MLQRLDLRNNVTPGIGVNVTATTHGHEQGKGIDQNRFLTYSPGG